MSDQKHPRVDRIFSRRRTTVDEVHGVMLAAIIDGELIAGDELRDQRWATELSLSRTPIREAIKRLECHGLADVAAARYTRVASFTALSARREAEGWAAIHIAVLRTIKAPFRRRFIAQLETVSRQCQNATSSRYRATKFAFFARIRAENEDFSVKLGATTAAYRLHLALPTLPEHHDADLALHVDVIAALRRKDLDGLEAIFARWTAAVTRPD